MKKYGITLMALIVLAITPFSCRERQPNDPDGDGIREVEPARQDNTDQYRDRYENDRANDTTARQRDSMPREPIMGDSANLLE